MPLAVCAYGKTREGRYFPVNEEEDGTYILNSEDMCMIEHIPELVDAGIDSFKIEGRAKSAYYTAVITNAYRAAIDAYMCSEPGSFVLPRWILDEVRKVSYRDYCTGFYFDSPHEKANISFEGGYRREWDVMAVVEDCRDGCIYCEQRNKFFKGDTLESLEPGKKPQSFVVTELFDENGEPTDSTPRAMMKFKMRSDLKFVPGTILRKQNIK